MNLNEGDEISVHDKMIVIEIAERNKSVRIKSNPTFLVKSFTKAGTLEEHFEDGGIDTVYIAALAIKHKITTITKGKNKGKSKYTLTIISDKI